MDLKKIFFALAFLPVLALQRIKGNLSENFFRRQDIHNLRHNRSGCVLHEKGQLILRLSVNGEKYLLTDADSLGCLRQFADVYCL